MIECLRLRNVGPAPWMEMELAPRFNLITGDNGLGKSFLLDVIWWALTRQWPQEVNPQMNAGYAARPATAGVDATIGVRARARSTTAEYEARYVPRDQAWVVPAGRPLLPGLVIYAHTDGSFSFWDPARNDWRQRGDADVSPRRPAQVFTQDEVWNGAYIQENGRRVPICYGLIMDWAAWISAQNDSHAHHEDGDRNPRVRWDRSPCRTGKSVAYLHRRPQGHPDHTHGLRRSNSHSARVRRGPPCRRVGLHAHFGVA